jgi:hypothetical protein
MAKSCDQVVDKWLLALQQELAKQLVPVVAVLYELIFEEIDKSSLVPGVVSAFESVAALS